MSRLVIAVIPLERTGSVKVPSKTPLLGRTYGNRFLLPDCRLSSRLGNCEGCGIFCFLIPHHLFDLRPFSRGDF